MQQSKTIPLRSVDGKKLDLKEGVLLSAEGEPIQQGARAPIQPTFIQMKGPLALLVALPIGLVMSAVVVVLGLFSGALLLGLRWLGGGKKISRG